MPLPCPSCPWRVDQGADAIPNYSHDKACGLLEATVGDGDAIRPIMACHQSADPEPRACLGYVAMVGWTNIRVRVAVMKERLPSPDAVLADCQAAGIALHPDYRSVLDKLERTRQ